MTHTTPQQARRMASALHEMGVGAAPNALRSLADQLEAVIAERDAYKLDAERYQWFARIATLGDSGGFDRAEKAFAHFNDADSCTKEELDSAIDAAIAKEAK